MPVSAKKASKVLKAETSLPQLQPDVAAEPGDVLVTSTKRSARGAGAAGRVGAGLVDVEPPSAKRGELRGKGQATKSSDRVRASRKGVQE